MPECRRGNEGADRTAPDVRLVSLMDHTPGQRQFRDERKLRDYYRGKNGGMTDAELDVLFEKRIAYQAAHAEANHREPRRARARLQHAIGQPRRHHCRSCRRGEARRRGDRRVSDHGRGGAGAARGRRPRPDGRTQSGARRLPRRQCRDGRARARRRARRAVVGLRAGEPADGGAAPAQAVPEIALPAAMRTVSEDAGRGGRIARIAARSRSASAPISSACVSRATFPRFAACGAAAIAWHEPDREQRCDCCRAARRLIGPGRLVLVVGPSGAGKDTLIAGARTACRDDATVVFPRRVVTRPASTFEDNDVMSKSAFEQAAVRGAFAFWWSAHGHHYGIPLAIDFDIETGRTVVCNVSRTVVRAIRWRYAHVVAVLVTAPKDVLAKRLAARDRASDGGIDERLHRADIEQLPARCDHRQRR